MFRFPILLSLVIFSSAFPGISVRALAEWTWNDPLPQGNLLVCAAANPDQSAVVAFGNYGTGVVGSPEGPWRTVPSLTGGSSLSGLVWAGDRFLAVGPATGLWESTDALEWRIRDPDVVADWIFSSGNHVFVVARDRVWSGSNDGTFQEGTLSALGLQAQVADAAFSSGRILLLGGNGSAVVGSSSGPWTPAPIPSGANLFILQGGPSGFLLGGLAAETPALFVSTDGLEWTPFAAPNGASNSFWVFPAAGGWIFQDYRRGTFHLWNGSSWENLQFASGSLPIPYVALPLEGAQTMLFGERGLIALARPGVPIQFQTSSALASNLLDPPRFAAAGIGPLVAAIDKNVSSAATVRFYISNNSSAWNAPSPPAVAGLSTLSPVDGSIVGYSVGAPSTLPGFYRLSSEGLWSPLALFEDFTPPFEGEVVGIAASPGQSAILALVRENLYNLDLSYSSSRSLLFSTNWRDWTPVSLPALRTHLPPAEEIIESLHWDGSRFILLLYPGRIFTSTDGRNWTPLPSLPEDAPSRLAAEFPGRSVPAANFAISAASDGTRLVARAAKLASDGTWLSALPRGSETLFVFENNRWWPSTASSPVPVGRRQILHADSRFHILGESSILSSPDGFQWSSHPIDATLSSLLWTGTKFVGFTDAFAILSHGGGLGGGTPIFSPSISPRSQTLSSQSASYVIGAALPPGPWSVRGLPNWATITPSSGNATAPFQLSVSVSENTSRVPRGAVLDIAGRTHLLVQLPPVPNTRLAAPAKTSNLSIPFTGDWSASASSLLSFAKNATSGKGNVRFTIPENPSPSPREIIVNLNGLDFIVEQQGQSPALLSSGTYSGLLGYLAPGLAPDSPASFESFDGSVSISVSKPSPKTPHGAFSAQVSLFDGNQTLRFTGKGAVASDGSLSGQWKSSTRGIARPSVQLVLRDDFGIDRAISGTFAANGTTYGLLAGKHIFHAKSNPLPASDAGTSTVFLSTFPTLESVVDIAVASASILPSGVVRFVGTLASGAKLTSSSFVWGATGSSLALPFSFPLPAGALSGFALRTPASPSFDWSGETTTWLSRGNNPVYGWSHLAAYTPPARARPALDWTAPADFAMAADNLDGTEGAILFSKPASLRASLPGGSASLKIAPATGLVTGSFTLPGSKKPASLLFGAVNQKYRATSTGSILGFATGSFPGRFSAFPK